MSARPILLLALSLALIVCIPAERGQSRAAARQNQSSGHFLPKQLVVADRCKSCHAAEVEGYARSAMAHSLRRAGQEPDGTVNAGGAKVTAYSTPDGSWQRWQAGGDTSNYHIDYVIGSGNHAAGYLINIDGHLFQSPIAFYKSRNAYDVAPGYEKTQEPDFTRPVAEGCVFCHAGGELHVSGTDNEYRAPVFSDEAITCERCHGPSEKHLADPRAGTIVNPAKLEAGARDSICEQCHLMGVARVPNPGREFRDFQPGQRLETTFTTYHDALPPGAPSGQFKVISHVEQLALSVCANSSQGKMWCGTCHDPHNKPAEPVAYYRSRCLTCHTKNFPSAHPDAESNCIGCHMPRRDAQDGGHTAFTDHRIQRRPQPQTESPANGDIAAWREPATDLQKRNLGIAYVNAGLQRRSADLLVRGYRLLTEVQTQYASDPEVFMWMGTALLVGGKASEAEFAFERVEQLNPKSAAAQTNIAAALRQAGDLPGAIAHLNRAVAIDPLHFSAIDALGQLYEQQGDPAAAKELAEKVRKKLEEAEGDSRKNEQPKQSASAPKPAEAVFKNIKTLKGTPSDRVVPTMRFISSALGVQCTFCHVEGHFEDDSKRPKQIARSMMQMTIAINQNDFEGSREVTCFSCHRGMPRPESVPAISSATGSLQADREPEGGERNITNVPELLPTAKEIIERYIQALGGAAALEKLVTRVETGTAEHHGSSYPVEIFVKAPDKLIVIEHLRAGESLTALNGDSGWTKIAGNAVRELHGADLASAHMDADLQLPLHFEQALPDLRVEYPETIRQRKCYVLSAYAQGEIAWKLFFDAGSGLLLRSVHFEDSPLGTDPTEIDYDRYREVDGVKVPFSRTVARVGDRTVIHIEAVQQNVFIDDAKFADPSATASTSH